MTYTSVVIFTIGILMFIESVIVVLFPKTIKEGLKQVIKSPKKIRNIGLLELIISIILIIISILIYTF